MQGELAPSFERAGAHLAVLKKMTADFREPVIWLVLPCPNGHCRAGTEPGQATGGDMTGKVAIVTGGSSGIGEATARQLHAAGYVVYAAARRADRMSALVAAGVRALAMDLTVEESMTSGIERVLAEAGRVDVLVNNAGYGSYGSLEEVPLSEARHQFEVNVFGSARLTQLVLPGMRAQRYGRIINISSIGGKIYGPLGDWYHATKFALEGLSDSLRVELQPFGIDVVVIEPGAITSEWGAIAAANLRERSAAGPYAALLTHPWVPEQTIRGHTPPPF
jgi:NAD(P)-dependent dehydrogenase (short-subunit alcohol dehydrogenase family)